uniref:Calponin-homology (CH) domain-containing protein n=1 Tax=Pyramimonas obovata TaxID=1411642 RepID=A0A7S0WNM2_9CHLO|mmetsp:Transcript_31741/g.69378  ORF Transcript_31741/g.69378 Transcript_31741/m.69378 type:complete len:350 (+) Transcript_31741:289-1338(+)
MAEVDNAQIESAQDHQSPPRENTTVSAETSPHTTPGARQRRTPRSSTEHFNLECLDEANALFWLNNHLADSQLSATTLKDLDDGRLLLALVDKLLGLGDTLQRKAHLTVANNKYKKIDNMSIVLDTIHSATGIPVPMSPLDLVTSLEQEEYSEILATIWQLVLQYDIEAAKDPVGWAERMRRLEQAQKEAAEEAQRRMQQVEREEREERESRRLTALQVLEERKRAEQRNSEEMPQASVAESRASLEEKLQEHAPQPTEAPQSPDTVFAQFPVHDSSAGLSVSKCEDPPSGDDSASELHTPRETARADDPDPSSSGREDRADPLEFLAWHTPPRVWANVLRELYSPLAS